MHMADGTMNFSFGAEGSGLYFTIVITVLNGVAKAEVKMIEGTMDLNALYWSDGDANAGEGSMDGFTKKDSALNMNGAEGSAQAWDGGQKLSNAGLGSAGTEKSTFLSTGETQEFTLSNLTDINMAKFLGVRATSVNGGDSIKMVDEGEPPQTNDHFPEWGKPDISHVTFYFDTPDGFAGDINGIVGEKGANDPDGWYTVKFDVAGAAGSEINDLDNWYQDALALIYAKVGDISEYLKGVAIKGGQTETWYDFDNNPNDVDTPPSVFVVENKELDDADNYVSWNATTDSFDFIFA
jgi:hypothetical protein